MSEYRCTFHRHNFDLDGVEIVCRIGDGVLELPGTAYGEASFRAVGALDMTAIRRLDKTIVAYALAITLPNGRPHLSWSSPAERDVFAFRLAKAADSPLYSDDNARLA